MIYMNNYAAEGIGKKPNGHVGFEEVTGLQTRAREGLTAKKTGLISQGMTKKPGEFSNLVQQ
jgi:hypothetical protein